MTEPAYSERRSASAIDKYAFQLAALLKTEACKSRKQRRTLKQIHEDLKELGFEGYYDRVAAFARVWREGQIDRVNSASKRTHGSIGSINSPLPHHRNWQRQLGVAGAALPQYVEAFSRFEATKMLRAEGKVKMEELEGLVRNRLWSVAKEF